MTVPGLPAQHEIVDPTGPPAPRRPVRVAVAGLGRAGIAHAAAVSSIPGCELVGVVDARAAARRDVRGLGYDAPSFGSVAKLVARTQPDALFVSAGWQERGPIARAALEAGVAVCVDPPIAPTLAEAAAVVRLAAERNTPLASCHALACHPVFARARAILASGALGEIRQVRSSTYLSRVFSPESQQRAAPAESAGGALVHSALDLLFVLLWLLGPPVQVRATSRRFYGPFEDEIHTMMALPGGAEVGLDCSWSVPGYPRQSSVIEAEGANGKMLISDDALEVELASGHGPLPSGPLRLGHSELPQAARFDLGGETLYLADASFLAWVAGGPPPAGRGDAALEALRVMDVVYESARDGGKPIAFVAP